ncbi:MAG: hypothetical protein WD738_18315 [Pirellulales bacterium]
MAAPRPPRCMQIRGICTACLMLLLFAALLACASSAFAHDVNHFELQQPREGKTYLVGDSIRARGEIHGGAVASAELEYVATGPGYSQGTLVSVSGTSFDATVPGPASPMTVDVSGYLYVYDVADPWAEQFTRRVYYVNPNQVGTLADGNGDVTAWGTNSHGETNVPAGSYAAIGTGLNFSAALRPDGTLAAWGRNDRGQMAVPGGTFVDLAAGGYHGLALRSDGTVAGWGGMNLFGQANVPSGTYSDIDGGVHHSLAIRSDGTLAAWGLNGFGQTNVPSGTFTDIASGDYHNIAIRSDGTLAAWGWNDAGQTLIPSGTFTHIAGGGEHSLAIRPDGTLAAWGANGAGQSVVPGGTFTAIAAGDLYSLAIHSDGSLRAWGDNTNGRTDVPGGTFVAVAAGPGGHNLALAARTDYDHLFISGTGISANLNRSITVAGNVNVETTTNFYNNPTATIAGVLFLDTGAAFTGSGTINAGEMQVAGSTAINAGQSFNIGSGGVNIQSTGSLEIAGGSLMGYIIVDGGTLTKTSGSLNVNSLLVTNGGLANITGPQSMGIVQVDPGASFLVSDILSITDNSLVVYGYASLGGLNLAISPSQGIEHVVNGSVDMTGDLTMTGEAGSLHHLLLFGSIIQTGSAMIAVGNSAADPGSFASIQTYGASTLTSGSGGLSVVRGGVITVEGILNINGPLIVDEGTLNGNPGADFNLAAGLPLTVTNSGIFNMPEQLTLAAGNNMLVTGTGARAEGLQDGTDHSLFVGAGGGDVTVTVTDGAELKGVDLLRITPTGTTGTGTHRVDVLSGGDITNLGNVELGNNPDGTFEAVFNVDGPGSTVTQTGASTLTIGGPSGTTATLNLTGGGTWTTGTGDITINPTGQINSTGGNFNANGDVLVDGGTIEGNFSLAAARSLTARNNAYLDIPATISGGATWLIESGAHLQGLQHIGVADGVATLIVDGIGTSFETGGGFWGLSGNGANITIRNGATANADLVRLARNPDPVSTTGVLTIESGAMMTIGTLVAGFGNTSDVSATVNVNGAGSVLMVGDLRLGQTEALGTFNVLNGGKLIVGNSGTLLGSQSAVINIDGGTVDLQVLTNNGGTINFAAGSLSYIGDLTVGAGGLLGSNLTLAANRQLTLSGTTTIDVSHTLTLAGGSLSTGDIAINGTFNFTSGQLAITGNDGLTIGGGGALGADVFLGQDANLVVTNALTIESGATLFASSPLTAGSVNIASGGQLFAGGATNDFGAGLTNSGDLVFTHATTVDGPVVNNAAVTALANVTFNDPVSGPGGFFGAGTLTFDSGYSPGASPAAVTFEGGVAFGASNTLTIELGGLAAGTEFDKLTIEGLLQLGGTLDIDLLSGFSPQAGQSFDILDWPALAGIFDTVNLPTLAGDLEWDLSNLYTTGVLAVAATFLPGDFNADGAVDAADYITWRKNDGSQQGYDTWRAHFGQTAGSGSHVAESLQDSDSTRPAVPEPTTFILASCAVCFFLSALNSHRRQQR